MLTTSGFYPHHSNPDLVFNEESIAQRFELYKNPVASEEKIVKFDKDTKF